MDQDRTEANRAQQVELYGMTMAQVMQALATTLGLNQTRTAATIGLSGAMLSQLVGGGRVKIGNPVVSARLAELRQLAEAVRAGRVAPEDVPASIERVRAISSAHQTTTTTPVAVTTAPQVDDQRLVQAVQDLFRATAGARDWLAVADLAERDHPQVAELLRTYGAARTDEALRHYAAVRRTLAGG